MVATKPVDFRKGHDGLAALVKNELHKDPFIRVLADPKRHAHNGARRNGRMVPPRGARHRLLQPASHEADGQKRTAEAH